MALKKSIQILWDLEERAGMFLGWLQSLFGGSFSWWGGIWSWLMTRWMQVWVNSGSWWWTGRPGVLRFMELQRGGHDWVTELNWWVTEEKFELPIKSEDYLKENKNFIPHWRADLQKHHFCLVHWTALGSVTRAPELGNSWLSRRTKFVSSALFP